MTKSSKHRTSGVGLPEESILEALAPGKQPDEAAGGEYSESGSPSTTQQGTQQFVTFIAGDEVFAADMSPVKEIIRVPEVVRVPLAPLALEGLMQLM